MLRFKCKGKKPPVKNTKLYFVLVGGDLGAENLTGHLENKMRRIGDIGRFNSNETEKKDVQTMAAAALLRKGGFQTVLDALK